MGRIGKWKKEMTDERWHTGGGFVLEDVTLWSVDDGSSEVYIHNTPKGWHTQAYRNYDFTLNQFHKTKENAMKAAINHMRRHPNG